jgi:RNA polymerase sigma-70 factor, ECF subfamily
MTRHPLATPHPSDPDGSGAAAVLDGLFRTHYADLYALAYRYVRSRAVAEEVIQDAFLTMWNRRAEWALARDLPRYTAGIVRNRALGHLRRERLELAWQQHAAASNAEDATLGQFTRDAGGDPDVGELAERIKMALRALPERAQQTVALRVYRQLTNAEIAEVMGVTVKAVERNFTRAMHALRDALTGSSST